MEVYDANPQQDTTATRLEIVDQIAELRVVLQQVEPTEEVN